MDVLFFLLLIGVTSMVASDDHYSESDPRETTDMNVSWCRLHQAEGKSRYVPFCNYTGSLSIATQLGARDWRLLWLVPE